MAEPTPSPAEDALSRVSAQIDAVRRTQPKNKDEARTRALELVRLNRIVADAERTMADSTAQQLIANGNGYANGHADGEIFTEEVASALATGIAPFVREVTADAVAPLNARLDELENLVRRLVQTVA